MNNSEKELQVQVLSSFHIILIFIAYVKINQNLSTWR